MSAAVTMPVLLMLLLVLQDIESPQPAPLATTLSGAPLPCQVEVCFVAILSPRECVGESATSAEVRCSRCKGEVYMQVDSETERGSKRVGKSGEEGNRAKESERERKSLPSSSVEQFNDEMPS